MADDFFVFGRTYKIAPRHGVEVSKHQMFFSGLICSYCELFFIFHEFSHILVKDVHGNELNDKDEEFLADYFAMKSMLTMGESSSELELLYLSCELSLMIFHTLEALNMMPMDSAHPPFKKRIDFLRKELKKECSEETYRAITNCAKIAEEIFDNIFMLVTRKSDEEEHYAKEVKLQISSILHKYGSTSVPDYLNSATALQEFIEHGHYQSLHDVLYSTAEECVQAMNKISSKNEHNCSNYRIPFNRYKLIIGFVNTLRALKTAFGDICFLHR